ncbi:BTB POZ domain-containing protein [Bandra megavirus]|uniref:BTB POZ domain-containing protein n=1 Tax=Bandra megavirus TaxID=2071566 RepID=A0A2K9V9U8_9VIRU|nr:BTB POZ domain-containing protein [Bandra megavirus]
MNLITKDFCSLFDSEILSDVKIILVDDKNQLSLNLHRVILFARCQFFEKMFSNFVEAKQFDVIVHVIDVDVAQDIIKNIYGFEINQPDNWQYKLKYYICCDYFGLKCQLPVNIKIPNDCFDDLLNLIDIIGYTNETIQIISNNLPLNYDISNLSVELLREINNNIYSNDMITLGYKFGITNIDIVNKNVSKIKNIHHKNYCKNLCYLSKMDKIIFTRNNKLMVYDLNADKFQKYTWLNTKFKSLAYNSKKNELIILVNNVIKNNSLIHIVCVETFNIIETIVDTDSKYNIKNIYLSSSGNKLAYVLEKKYNFQSKIKEYIKVYHFETKTHILVDKSLNNENIVKIKLINNDTQIIFSDIKGKIILCNILGKNILYTGLIFNTHHGLSDFDVYQDKYIIMARGYVVYIYDFINKKIIHRLPCDFNNVKIIPGGKMITYGNRRTIIYDIMQGEISTEYSNLNYIQDLYFINYGNSLKKRIENYLD